MELTLSDLKTRDLKRLHILNNRSWVSRYDLEKILSDSGKEADQEAIDNLVDEAGLKSFGEDKFTTPEIHEAERAVIASTIARKNEESHHLSPETINQVLANNPTLKDEQAGSIKYMGASGGNVSLIGAAGTGKSFTMNVARQAFESEDFNVVGISPSGAAAIELEKSSGIKSKTAFRFYSDFMSGRQEVTSKTVIVHDEAGMTDSITYARIVSIAHEKGAKVISLGDPNQFESVGTASLFARVCEEVDAPEMIQIARQKDPAKQEISKDFYNQDGSQAVEKMNELGMIHQDKSENLKANLVNDYLDYRSQGKSVLALASTNRDVSQLNDQIVSELVSRGELNPNESLVAEVTSPTGAKEDLTLYKNEQIMFRMSNSKNGLVNGDVGTIKELTENGLVVDVDRGDDSFEAHVDLTQYDHIQPAYAMTVHKSQGATVDKSFIAPDTRYLDSRAMYVASTRGRDGVEVYIPEGSLEQLKTASDRTITKSSTLDEYTVREDVAFDQYVESVAGSNEPLLSAPASPSHHFEELKVSERYGQLKREKAMPELTSLREMAYQAAGQNEAPEAGHVRGQAQKFGVGGKSEDRTQAFVAMLNDSSSPLEQAQGRFDREDILRISTAQRQAKQEPSVTQTESRKVEKRSEANAEAVQFHKDAILERTQAAREYQTEVDKVYERAGFSNTNFRSNGQASYAGEQLRGGPSLLTQNTRDYMLSLQENKFGRGDKAQTGRAAFSLDKAWMAAHLKAERFREAQADRYHSGTVEGMLEYKHAQMMDDWSTKLARGQGGTLNEQQQAWRDIESTIREDREALQNLLQDKSSSADFAEKTGVHITPEGEVKFGAHMSAEERREAKQAERDLLAENPHMATVEYQRDPDAYLKKMASEQNSEREDQHQSQPLEFQDFNKSEKDQGDASLAVEEIDRAESQELQDEINAENEAREEEEVERSEKEDQEEEQSRQLEEAQAEQEANEEAQAGADEQARIDQEKADQDRADFAEQSRKDEEAQRQQEEESRVQEEADEQQQREDQERAEQEDIERQQQEAEESDRLQRERDEEQAQQEQQELEREEEEAEEARQQQEEEIDEQERRDTQELQDELNNPEAHARKQEEERQEREEESQQLTEDLNEQEGRETPSQEDIERQQQEITEEMDRQEREEMEQEAQERDKADQQQIDDQVEERDRMEREDQEEALSEEQDEPELSAEEQAAHEAEIEDQRRLEEDLNREAEEEREPQHLTEEELQDVDRAAEDEDQGMTEEQAQEYDAKLQAEAEEREAYNQEQQVQQESPEETEEENKRLEEEMEQAEQQRHEEQAAEQERRRKEQEEENEIGY